MLRKIYIWALLSRPVDLIATIGTAIRHRQMYHIWTGISPDVAEAMSPPQKMRDALRGWWIRK